MQWSTTTGAHRQEQSMSVSRRRTALALFAACVVAATCGCGGYSQSANTPAKGEESGKKMVDFYNDPANRMKMQGGGRPPGVGVPGMGQPGGPPPGMPTAPVGGGG
jgi:hypothetical protein